MAIKCGELICLKNTFCKRRYVNCRVRVRAAACVQKVLVPAVIYGWSQDAQSITLRHNELIRNLQEQGFYSQVITVDFGDRKESVVFCVTCNVTLLSLLLCTLTCCALKMTKKLLYT